MVERVVVAKPLKFVAVWNSVVDNINRMSFSRSCIRSHICHDVEHIVCVVLSSGRVRRGCLSKGSWYSIHRTFDDEEGCRSSVTVDGSHAKSTSLSHSV